MTISRIFNRFWIGKFSSIISQAQWKNLLKKVISQGKEKLVKYINDGSGIISLAKKGKLKLWKDKVNGEEDRTTFDTFYRIKLNYRKGGILLPVI